MIGRYLGVRLLLAIPTLLAVLLITFGLTFISPFDPVKIMLSASEITALDTEANIQRMREALGLQRPFLVQFGDYVQKLLRGDWGRSINGQRDIWNMISVALPVSFQIGLGAALLTALVGIPLGALAALRQNTWLDYMIVSGTLVLRTIPVFVLAPVLLVIFVLELKLMSVPRGWSGLFSSKAILPVLLLAFGPLAIVVRQTRQAIIDVLGNDYVRTARAKGLGDWLIIWRHVLRNALIPIVTIMGFVTEGLIVGSIFLENIFAIPGFGAISENAFRQFDYPVIMGVTVVGATLVIITNTIIDVVYPFLDPRVKLE
ncbi:MAG: Oligopeptide transport system permease protein OppB [Chloroflexota bacterium]|jgi:ABC-type dipeptide/oligopeptide/nickel transport system permease component